MDHVLAKLKRLRKSPYRKLLSDTALFVPVNVGDLNKVDYNPDHSLDEDSWFEVKDFSNKEFFLDILNNHLDVKNYENMSKNQFLDISFILSLQGDDVYFQKVTPSSFIKKKTISFGDVASIDEDGSRIVVKDKPDAIFLREKDSLLFRNLAAISSIFRGIDQLYKEATDEEVKDFLNSGLVELAEGYGHDAVSKPNRKRLALVVDEIKNMSQEKRDDLFRYILEYCEGDIETTDDDQKFKLSTNEQLRLIIYGLEERFYTTRSSGERRLANSVEAIG